MRQVKRSVATVMPEIGFEEEPISPVNREETVTKRKPKRMMRSAPRMFMWSLGASMMTARRATMPMPTSLSERSWSVRGVAIPALPCRPFKSARPPFKPCQIVGSERKRLMMPPAATAPAPM